MRITKSQLRRIIQEAAPLMAEPDELMAEDIATDHMVGQAIESLYEAIMGVLDRYPGAPITGAEIAKEVSESVYETLLMALSESWDLTGG